MPDKSALQTMTERLRALTSGKPEFNHFDALRSGTPKGSKVPNIADPVQREIAAQVERMKRLGMSKGQVPGTEATKVVQNAPKVDTGTGMGAGLLRSAAQIVGFEGARALAQSAGTPGQSRMSGLGIAGPAPVYQTPFNDVTPEQVAADKARRAGQTDLQRVTGDLSGKDEPLPSTYTVMGVEYDSASGQAIQPDTGKIAPGGYSVPASGTDTSTSRRDDPRNADYISARDALTPESSAADIKSVEDAGMAAWAKANPGLVAEAVRRGPKQAGYDVLKEIAFEEVAAPEARELTEADMTSYDSLETFKPSGMAARDRQDPTAGGVKLEDAQVLEGAIPQNAAEKADEFVKSRIERITRR